MLSYGNRLFRSCTPHFYGLTAPSILKGLCVIVYVFQVWVSTCKPVRRKAASVHSSHIQIITDIKSPHSCSPLKHQARSIPKKI